jgi:hypothetical protein
LKAERCPFGGGKLLIASRQDNSSAGQPTIISENGDTANCLRARASLNATDNTIMEYATKADLEHLSEPRSEWGDI